MLGESLMVAPITASSTDEYPNDDCTVGEHWGCVDARWSNHGLFATDLGNFYDLTHNSCADKCAKLNYKIMGVGWGGKLHGSQCLCSHCVWSWFPLNFDEAPCFEAKKWIRQPRKRTSAHPCKQRKWFSTPIPTGGL